MDAVERSPHYTTGREDYQQLEQKMKRVFQKCKRVDFALQRLRIQSELTTATVESDYTLVLISLRQDLPTSLSGKLFFTLIQSDDGWKIIRIDTPTR